MTKTSSPQPPTAAPSKFPATFLPRAPDLGAAVLLALGAGVDDERLEEVGKGEVEEEAAAELGEGDVAKVVPVAEAVVVAAASAVEVTTLVVAVAVGVGKDDESVRIAVGTEAVDAKPSVDASTALLLAEDAPAAALDAASEAVVSPLWTAAEA